MTSPWITCSFLSCSNRPPPECTIHLGNPVVPELNNMKAGWLKGTCSKGILEGNWSSGTDDKKPSQVVLWKISRVSYLYCNSWNIHLQFTSFQLLSDLQRLAQMGSWRPFVRRVSLVPTRVVRTFGQRRLELAAGFTFHNLGNFWCMIQSLAIINNSVYGEQYLGLNLGKSIQDTLDNSPHLVFTYPLSFSTLNNPPLVRNLAMSSYEVVSIEM